ncbi:MAG TPA: DUF1015 domain-containing protein [Baekduia sp.]|uniref:DUF1015 domain-containing protein n=1 Tax=Baekduia sp. TaxID=2600305 RepID=UPI002C2F5161|nr:DUF1015 domain-containing protein [Baekduia sp.]HMJ35427.1 DUF1015 domain-containing protein [Baekduia sp.]
MADVQAFRALRYDLGVVGSLESVIAPPYDVIDPEQRARLAARSSHNVVNVDLPEAPLGGDAYEEAARLFELWRRQGAVVRDETPALWALRQDYVGPDGRSLTRRGIFARVRVEEYGAGRIRPHERTHPGPKEDRLRLTRATRANLSPIFSLYDDPAGAAWGALAPHVTGDPWGTATDADGTVNSLWRIDDGAAIARVRMAMGETELLIADGHHRYETARVYAEEIGGEGDHRYVLMCLVALQDPGLTIFPTHRLLNQVKDPEVQQRLGRYLRETFDIAPIEQSELRPPGDAGAPTPLTMGYIDSFHQQAYRLVLKDQAIADAALADYPEPYRHLDTAVLEALVFEGVLGMTEDDISHLNGLGYSRTDDEALQAVLSKDYDCAFFLRGSPVGQVQEIAAAGVNMPPKSTYFFPKVPTGLMFNPLA